MFFFSYKMPIILFHELEKKSTGKNNSMGQNDRGIGKLYLQLNLERLPFARNNQLKRNGLSGTAKFLLKWFR